MTWYSKAIALGLFIVISLGGFWFGLSVGYVKGYVSGVAAFLPGANSTATIPTSSTPDSYYQNVAEWQTSQNNTGGFRVAYPIDFSVGEYDQQNPSANWSMDNQNGSSGNLFFTLDIPRTFEPQTNFADASLTVGASANGVDVAQCVTSASGIGPAVTTSTAIINGVAFTTFNSTGVGAGNLYETTSYRTLHAGQCYAVEYTIHSGQIGNYPAEYNLKPLDEAKLKDVLDRIVGTFKFQ